MKFKSPVYSQVSGSIAGITYAHNQSGMYARARSIPVNPNSPAQQVTRSAMISAANAWINRTQGQRDSWNTYAANVPVTNSLGDQIFLTGQQMFVRTNTVRFLLGLARVNTGPSVFDLGAPVTSISAAVVNAGPPETLDLVVEIDGGASDAGDVVWQVGLNQNPSRTFYRSPYRFVNGTPVAATDPTAAPSSNTNALPFGDVDAGDIVPMRFRVCYDDGRLTPTFESLVTLT